eukprot:augustus_masked-scaffold_9-processed-gene-6.6-mRNA-1 protein AED:0.18 eAED:0.18 QI:0/-1/0/1/-1/1/1/0/341
MASGFFTCDLLDSDLTFDNYRQECCEECCSTSYGDVTPLYCRQGCLSPFRTNDCAAAYEENDCRRTGLNYYYGTLATDLYRTEQWCCMTELIFGEYDDERTGIYSEEECRQHNFDSPTGYPSFHPTKQPTSAPTLPTSSPTSFPTYNPSVEPTKHPSYSPSDSPTRNPTEHPTPFPTFFPSTSPTSKPTISPTDFPTRKPTRNPTVFPTYYPSIHPTQNPTVDPTAFPTNPPTNLPTDFPTRSPTLSPTIFPTRDETVAPSGSPQVETDQELIPVDSDIAILGLGSLVIVLGITVCCLMRRNRTEDVVRKEILKYQQQQQAGVQNLNVAEELDVPKAQLIE